MGSLRSGKPAAPSAPAIGSVGVGLGIKKNQHGDFMVTDVTKGGPAARSGRVNVGDILQQVGDQDVCRPPPQPSTRKTRKTRNPKP